MNYNEMRNFIEADRKSFFDKNNRNFLGLTGDFEKDVKAFRETCDYINNLAKASESDLYISEGTIQKNIEYIKLCYKSAGWEIKE